MRRGAFLLALATAAGAQVSDGGRLDTGVSRPCADCGASVYGRRDTANRADSIARRVTSIALRPLDVADENARSKTLPPDRAGWWQRHLADTIAHGAATTADIASSRGLVEVNPILRDSRGQLGARGISIKLGIFAAVELAKWRIARRHPQDRWVRALSLAPAALYVGAASHNWRIR